MDGFAVRAEDLPEPGRTLRVVGESRAGRAVDDLDVGPGECARIMTGGIVPAGADAVVMVERTKEDRAAGQVTVDDAPSAGQHIRVRGQDMRQGDEVLAAGVPIHAAEIAALTSLGLSHVRVHRAPTVAVLSTGDEIVEPDRIPAPHQVRNSNAYVLLEQLREMELVGRYLGIATDEREDLDARVREGLAADVLLITGGVSMGEYDLVGESLSAAGMDLLFHKVRIKPGKPILAGKAGDCLVVGLPGNPVSTFVGFAVFVAPVLRKLSGHALRDEPTLQATLGAPLRSKPGRPTYHLAHAEATGGRLTARPVRATGSGDVLAMTRANAFIVTGVEGADLAEGDEVDVLLWREFSLR
jgi:molybdopterin molybdotransferase